MEKIVKVARSKEKQTLFLYTEKDGKKFFINMVKDHKAFKPEIKDSAKTYKITFTGYKTDENSVTLFDVIDFIMMS